MKSIGKITHPLPSIIMTHVHLCGVTLSINLDF